MADPFSAYQKPATVAGDPFAAYQKPVQPATLPNVTNDDLKRFGLGALKLAPVAGATIATALAPEVSLPAMAGIAALGGVGGEGVRQGVLAATDSEGAPDSFGQAAGRSAVSGLEQGVGELGGRFLAKPLGWALDRISPTRLYGSALRPSATLEPAARDALIQTGLRERIPVSEPGLRKLQGLKGDLNSQIEQLISRAPDAEISPLDVTKPVNRTRALFANQVNPNADVAAINGAKREFLDKHTMKAPFTKIAPGIDEPGFIPVGSGVTRIKQPLSLGEAQAEKRGTYKMLEGKYDELSSASTEAQKSLARGLKDQIAARVPKVAPLNAREGKLIDLQAPLARSLNVDANQPVGSLLRIPLVNSPAVKSGAAIGMDAIGKSAVGRAIGSVLNPKRSIPFAARLAANRGL